jgi:hypothetical protein
MYDDSANTLNAFQMQTKAIVIIACGNAHSTIAGRKIISHKTQVYSYEDAGLHTADCRFLTKDIFNPSGKTKKMFLGSSSP